MFGETVLKLTINIYELFIEVYIMYMKQDEGARAC